MMVGGVVLVRLVAVVVRVVVVLVVGWLACLVMLLEAVVCDVVGVGVVSTVCVEVVAMTVLIKFN